MKTHVVILTILFKFSLCRDYYVGMFKKNDILVAQDTLYKDKNHFGFSTAKYGRAFRCPITYFRISDRLGVGRPPAVRVTRGGLQKKYVTLLLTSSYNTPIAVNIYIGCENKLTTSTSTTPETDTKDESNAKEEMTTVVDEGESDGEGEAVTEGKAEAGGEGGDEPAAEVEGEGGGEIAEPPAHTEER